MRAVPRDRHDHRQRLTDGVAARFLAGCHASSSAPCALRGTTMTRRLIEMIEAEVERARDRGEYLPVITRTLDEEVLLGDPVTSITFDGRAGQSNRNRYVVHVAAGRRAIGERNPPNLTRGRLPGGRREFAGRYGRAAAGSGRRPADVAGATSAPKGRGRRDATGRREQQLFSDRHRRHGECRRRRRAGLPAGDTSDTVVSPRPRRRPVLGRAAAAGKRKSGEGCPEWPAGARTAPSTSDRCR